MKENEFFDTFPGPKCVSVETPIAHAASAQLERGWVQRTLRQARSGSVASIHFGSTLPGDET
jgi:hypothetical protein